MSRWGLGPKVCMHHFGCGMNWIKGYYMIVKVKNETFWFSTYSMEMHSLTSSSCIICLWGETFGSRTILLHYIVEIVLYCLRIIVFMFNWIGVILQMVTSTKWNTWDWQGLSHQVHAMFDLNISELKHVLVLLFPACCIWISDCLQTINQIVIVGRLLYWCILIDSF